MVRLSALRLKSRTKRHRMPSKTVNPDLAKERQKATFNVEEFTTWWSDGETKKEERRALGKFSKVVT